MSNLETLKNKTSEFFEKHWGDEKPFPEWNAEWDWQGSVPNYELGGLYAIFSKDELLYIGLGNSLGGGIYKEHGISRRLSAHVVEVATDEGSYRPKGYWKKLAVDKIATIGFTKELSYLAPALEDYLIGQIKPPQNTNKSKGA